MRLQQVVQPGRPGSFFEGHVHISTQPVDELQKHAPFGLDDAFHYEFSNSIHHCDRNTFLVHVHADIFSNRHKGCSFLERLSYALQTYSKRGRLFIMRVYECVRFTWPKNRLLGHMTKDEILARKTG